MAAEHPPLSATDKLIETVRASNLHLFFCNAYKVVPTALQLRTYPCQSELFKETIFELMRPFVHGCATSAELSGSSYEELAEKQCGKVGVDASFMSFFKASMETTWSSSGASSKTTAFRQEMKQWSAGTVSLAGDSQTHREHLTPRAKDLLDNASLEDIENDLGMFYVSTITVGGEVSICMSSESQKITSANCLSIEASLAGGFCGAKFGATFDYKSEKKEESGGGSITCHANLDGGDPEKFELSRGFDMAVQREWRNSVLSRPIVISFSLRRVRDLMPQSRRKEPEVGREQKRPRLDTKYFVKLVSAHHWQPSNWYLAAERLFEQVKIGDMNFGPTDFRDDKSTWAAVHKDVRISWTLNPAGDNRFYIKICDAAAKQEHPGYYLEAHRHERKDERNDDSSYVHVHDDAAGIWELEASEGGGDLFKIKLVGHRFGNHGQEDGWYLGAHRTDGDKRDHVSTYIIVHRPSSEVNTCLWKFEKC